MKQLINLVRKILGQKGIDLITQLIKKIVLINHKFGLISRKKYINKKYIKEYKEFKFKNSHVFFGYYDLNPLNNNLLLAHKTDYTLKNNSIGFFDVDSKKFKHIDSTSLCSYQFGSRLQWINENEIIYNKKTNEGNSIIHNIKTKKDKYLKYPIFQVYKNSNLALSLNFKHMFKFEKGYGYPNYSDSRKCGIYLMDINKNNSKEVVNLEKCIKFVKDNSMNIENSYFILPFFSPNGKKIAFLLKSKSNNKTLAKLIVCNLDGSNLTLLNTNGYIAHYNWIDDEKIVYVLKDNNKTNYFEIDINKKSKNLIKQINEDGHPSKFKDYIISDTYPSLIKREQKLFQIKNGKNTLLYQSISNYNHNYEMKCDFHPKNCNNEFICIDDGSEYYRKMLLFKI